MDQLHFTISFIYEFIPKSLQVHLSADIEMIARDACFVRNIQRINTNESSLLPLLKLVNVQGRWMHSNTGKESNISRAIGEAINRHLKQLSGTYDEMKDN